jgi:signal transduction histidine kinase
MQITTLLEKIRPVCVHRLSHSLARRESVRINFVRQLNDFFDLLDQAVILGEPAWIHGILKKWVESRTQTDFMHKDASLVTILDKILMETIKTSREVLDSSESLLLVETLFPMFSSALLYVNELETKNHVDTMSKKLEEARIALENLDKIKSDFISVAAHELKTPLTLIEGYAAMLEEIILDNDDESKTVLLFEGMTNGIRRLQSIISDMIDVSLLDTNLMDLQFQPVFFKQIMDIVRRELSRYAIDRNLMVTAENFNGCEKMTFADPERLCQAFRNILTNAVKYTPDGGEISVNGRTLPGFIEITVSDTGIGIDEEYHEAIFQKFSRLGTTQLHSTGKTKFKGGGPGLGLPITKGLIEAHGGAIWVESEGHDEVQLPGTTFHILLPILEEAPDKKYAKLFKPLKENPLESKKEI